MEHVGTVFGGLAPGIFAFVLTVRVVLIPFTLPLARRTRARQKVVDRIKPEIKAVRAEHKKDPSQMAKELKALHERHGISQVDGPGAIGALIQLPILIALFQAVFEVSRDTPLASGGLLIGIAASAVSVFGVVAAGQGNSKPLVALSGILPVVIAVWLGLGIGLYLLAFYLGSAVQGLLMQRSKMVDDPSPVQTG